MQVPDVEIMLSISGDIVCVGVIDESLMPREFDFNFEASFVEHPDVLLEVIIVGEEFVDFVMTGISLIEAPFSEYSGVLFEVIIGDEKFVVWY